MGTLNWTKGSCAVFVLCSATVIASAQSFTTLVTFDGENGAAPYAGLTQAADGNLYGTTSGGGFYGRGMIFKMTRSGTLTTLYDFCPQSGCTDGEDPWAGLVQSIDGDFYGTTLYGGSTSQAGGYGTIFKITPSGALTTLYRFCSENGCADGSSPYAGLIQATDGNFYGTTFSGGANGYGTVFKVTPSGTLTTLHSFSGTDGSYPFARLVQSTDGDLYGTTSYGGAPLWGTVFKITPSGTLTTVLTFDGTDGAYPVAALIQATDGSFYGTTNDGGANGFGTVFKMTSSGALTTLYSFCSQGNCADGSYPLGGVVQATDGSFYGTTSARGNGTNSGTIFKITQDGKLTILYSFCSQSGCTDGAAPEAALLQDTNGKLYGTTTGYLYGIGTIFSLSQGLRPFIEAEPAFGKAGAAVRILGTGLTGSTSVSFAGVPASFKVVSSSEITAIVPVGASTGKVQVVTPSLTLSSNVPFRVRP